jgi:hypothetical protein
MDIKHGYFYRRIIGNHPVLDAVVKVLHAEVFSMSVPTAPPVVMFRHFSDLGQKLFPHKFEYCFRDKFEREFEGPLEWDDALKEFK